MKRVVILSATLCLIVSALAFSNVQLPENPFLRIQKEEKNPWTHLALKNKVENFQFAIVTDRTGGHRPGIFEAAATKINLMQPEFVMSVGDLIEGYKEDEEILKSQWDEFNGFVQGLEMPFFYVPGNHDISNLKMLPVWQNQFGRTYFSFVYHDVLFIGLNSEDPPGYTVTLEPTTPEGKPIKLTPGRLSDEQLAWLKTTLAEHPGVRWTYLFLHKPMWHYGDKSNWAAVEELLGERPRTVFAGHEHRFRATAVGPWTYYALATTGGGSKLRGPESGEFDHIVWVTQTADGPRISNLMLDGIWSADPLTEAKAKPKKPEPPASVEAKPAEAKKP